MNSPREPRSLEPRIRSGVVMSGIGLLFLLAVAVTFVARGPGRVPTAPMWRVENADAERGRIALVAYGCGACHTIPGIREAEARVGPRLDRFAEQSYIAGVLENTPANLVRWIRDPQAVNPRTVMPDLGVSEEEARDIAAYLYAVDR